MFRGAKTVVGGKYKEDDTNLNISSVLGKRKCGEKSEMSN